jgi:molybdopterin synthase sulfur carrier subunit
VHFLACERGLSDDGPDEPLPEAVLRGDEPSLVIGARAGG